MSGFQLLRELKLSPLGADLSAFQSPAGEAELAAIQQTADSLIEQWVGFPLLWHIQADEIAPVANVNLSVFPAHNPIRAVKSFAILWSATQGTRQTRPVPTQTVELVPPWSNPMMFGDVQVDRTVGLVNVTSLAGLMGFPWASFAGTGSEVILTYTAGFDPPTPGTPETFLTTSVGAQTTPTATQFSVEAGYGQYLQTNIPIAVGASSGTVLSVSTDLVTLTAPISVPTVGDVVTQGDGVVLPVPDWLKEVERLTVRHLVNLRNATSGGAAGVGQMQVGSVKWTLPATVQPALPDNVKETLDHYYGDMMSLEMA